MDIIDFKEHYYSLLSNLTNTQKEELEFRIKEHLTEYNNITFTEIIITLLECNYEKGGYIIHYRTKTFLSAQHFISFFTMKQLLFFITNRKGVKGDR